MKLDQLLEDIGGCYYSAVTLTRSSSIFDHSDHILRTDRNGNWFFLLDELDESTAIYDTSDLPDDVDSIEFKITFNL